MPTLFATFGSFAVAFLSLHSLIEYVKDQEEYHGKKMFREESLGLLREYGVEFDEKYLE